jgi:ribonuclease HII
LTRRARETVYLRLREFGRRYSLSLPPSVVDRYVRDGRLNTMEAEAFARLVRLARPSVAYVDACDPVAERFGRLVSRLCGEATRVIAEHHADRDRPIVAAASIIAKVRRDRAIERLRTRLGPELGSGYPSDHRTVDFVRDALSRRGPAPLWLRASWATTGRLNAELSARSLESFGP